MSGLVELGFLPVVAPLPGAEGRFRSEPHGNRTKLAARLGYQELLNTLSTRLL